MKKAFVIIILLCCSAQAQLIPFSAQQFNDETFTLWDDGDPTKRAMFELSGITTNTTRIITLYDANGMPLYNIIEDTTPEFGGNVSGQQLYSIDHIVDINMSGDLTGASGNISMWTNDESYLKNIKEDTSPQLGGDLDGQSLYDLDNIVDISADGDITAGNNFYASSGLSSSLSYSFTTNPTSGWFFNPSGRRIYTYTDGVQRARIGSAGLFLSVPLDMQANDITGVEYIQVQAGSAAAPSIQLNTSDEDGFYTVGRGSIGVATNNILRLTIANAGITSAVPLDIGDNAFTVSGDEIVGSDGVVNKAAVEDSGNWDNAFTHVSNDGTDHSFIDQNVASTASPTFADLTLTAEDAALDLSSAGGSSGIHNLVKLSIKSLAAVELGTAIYSGFSKNAGNEFFNLIGGATGGTIFGGGVDADDYRRIRIEAGGKMRWGPGTATTDVVFERPFANALKISDGSTGGNLIVRGALSIGKFSAPTVALDVTGAAKIGDGTNDAVIGTTGNMSFTGTAELIIPSSATLPGTANVGSIYLDTDAGAHGTVYMYADGAWRIIVALP